MPLSSFLRTSVIWGAQRQLTSASQGAAKSFSSALLTNGLHSSSSAAKVGSGAVDVLLFRTWNGARNKLLLGSGCNLLHKQAFTRPVVSGGETSSAAIDKIKQLLSHLTKSSSVWQPQGFSTLSTYTTGLLRKQSVVGQLRKNVSAKYGIYWTQGAYQSTRVWQQFQGATKLLVFQSRIQGSLGKLRQQVSLFRGGSLRQGYSRQDPNTILYSLIGANVAVWLLWSQPKLQAFMTRHFLASVDAIANGRLHTIITANFSHTDGSHILLNMISLYFFGQSVGYQYGGKALLGLYLAGGVGCMAGYCLYWTYYVPWREGLNPRLYNARRTPPCQGASGSVMAIMMLSILSDPFRTVYVNLFIPVPALLFGAFVVYSDLSGAIGRDYSSRVGYSGHLGGAAMGAAAWAYLRHIRFR